MFPAFHPLPRQRAGPSRLSLRSAPHPPTPPVCRCRPGSSCGSLAKCPYLGSANQRRHFAAQHRGLDSLGPRPRAFIGEERHRADLARTVARLAVLLQDRQHVFVKGDRRSGNIRRHHRRPKRRNPNEKAAPYAHTLPLDRAYPAFRAVNSGAPARSALIGGLLATAVENNSGMLLTLLVSGALKDSCWARKATRSRVASELRGRAGPDRFLSRLGSLTTLKYCFARSAFRIGSSVRVLQKQGCRRSAGNIFFRHLSRQPWQGTHRTFPAPLFCR